MMILSVHLLVLIHSLDKYRLAIKLISYLFLHSSLINSHILFSHSSLFLNINTNMILMEIMTMAMTITFSINSDPAKVTFTPTIQYLPFRLAGVVQCYIKANPPLQYVTWTKDKRLLEPYQTKDIVIMNNGSLLFTRVNQNHQVSKSINFNDVCQIFRMEMVSVVFFGTQVN